MPSYIQALFIKLWCKKRNWGISSYSKLELCYTELSFIFQKSTTGIKKHHIGVWNQCLGPKNSLKLLPNYSYFYKLPSTEINILIIYNSGKVLKNQAVLGNKIYCISPERCRFYVQTKSIMYGFLKIWHQALKGVWISIKIFIEDILHQFTSMKLYSFRGN